MKNAAAFFSFARERHAIYLKRAAGAPPPWTNDPILAKYKFTNVFRELDRTTVWFRRHIREPLRNDPRVLFATVAFRWFNKIDTAEYLSHFELDPSWHGEGSLFSNWDIAIAERRLRTALPKGPWTNGAYIIKTPDGMDKLKGVLWCIEHFRNTTISNVLLSADYPRRLETWWRLLMKCPYLGQFMAYEVVTDLRHTCLLENAPDIMTWANPGPGACRGYGRVTGEGVDYYDRGKERDREAVIKGMQWLLYGANSGASRWPTEWPRWEMREVEHTLCEFDKYERTRLGEGKPKQLFRPKETVPC